jgi:acyl-CoA dehydrogenase
MDFTFPEELVLLRETVKRYVDKELRPLEKGIEEAGKADPEVLRSLRLKAAKVGIYAHNLPTEIGGGGLNCLGQVVVAEELGRTTMPLSRSAGYLPALLAYCNPQQQSWFVDPLVSGEKFVTYAVTEPDAGSDVGSTKTRASKVNDTWVLNGGKCFVSNVDIADWVIVVAVTDGQASINNRFTLFIVEKSNPGFHFIRNIRKIGWHGAEFCQFSLDDCHVSDDSIIGEVNGGFELIMLAINLTRIHLGGIYVGMGLELRDLAIGYAKQRKTFGKRLGDHQAIQFMLADIDCELEACRLLVYAAAVAYDKNHSDMRIAASRAKLMGSEMAFRTADRVLQIFGAAGVSCDYPIERMFRDSRAFRIGEGTSEIQRTQIARHLLR